MSEEAVIWAIKRGLPSSTQVRVEGQSRWMPLDDHPPFADELVARTSGRRKSFSKGLLGYTWQEILALVFALGVVAGLVIGIGWLEENWHSVRKEIGAREQGSHWSASLPAFEEHLTVHADPPPPASAEAQSNAPRDPKARAKLATNALNGAGTDPRAAVCKARGLLEPILEADRKKPEVERAFSLLSSKELPILRQDQSEFEKHRGVVCGDGTRPRDCPCRGAHESCCVLHGGVASCEPLPTRIRCF